MIDATKNVSSSAIPPSMSFMTSLKPIQSLNWLYHLHYVRGEFEQCEKQIERYDFKSEYSWYLRGLIKLRSNGDVRQALEYFNEIKSLNNPTYIKAVVRCFVLLGRHTNVCDLVRESALIQAPNDWQLWHMLGIAYFHLGNIPLAKDAFQHALQTTNRTDPHIMLSNCNLIEGDPKAAVFVLRRAAELSPEDTQLATKLGILLMSQGMAGKGVDKVMQLQHISANTAGDLALSLAVGSVLQDVKQDIDGALYRYKMANIFESPGLWNNIALCFSARKKYVAAVSCLKRALYLNPFDWRMNYNLGLLNLQLRQFASAFHYLKTAATMSNGASNVFTLLAICLENLDDDLNARQAHISATKSSMTSHTPVPLINYAIHLYNKDPQQFRDVIIELIMEFEQNWLKQQHSSPNYFDIEVMKAATRLANSLNLSQHMAWLHPPPQPSTSTTVASGPAGVTTVTSSGTLVSMPALPSPVPGNGQVIQPSPTGSGDGSIGKADSA